MPNPALDIARSAAALSKAPTDFAAWLSLASSLEGSGKADEAAEAFARLGEAANRLGQVALAMACVCQLREYEQSSKRADELVSAIAKLHCRASKVIDKKLKPSPPAPPPSKAIEDEVADDDVSLADAVAAAVKALEEASVKVAELAPDRLPPTPLVGVLSRDELRELAAVVEHRQVSAGEVVIEVGEPATKLFWVARGRLTVHRDEHLLGELRANAFFGEIALVGATDRTAEVRAATSVWLLDIPAESVEKLAGRSPRLAKVLANYAKARILSNVMRTSGLFARLSEDERRSLLPRFEPRILEPGERFIEGGKANERLFVVASGAVEVRDGDSVIAELSVGDGVGEQSLLSRKPASHDVVASGRAVVLGLDRAAFDDLAVTHPGLLAEAYRLLVEREQASGEPIVHDAADLVI